ncbi:MAG: threonine/serine exporter family protein [Phycisphaeraceae bacterium]|nr:threonine/serine exporter family protein [Phycisphaeraceae bacterium]
MPDPARDFASQMVPADAHASFILRLARALHEAGTPAHRLEEAVVGACERLGVAAQVFSTPTSILIAFGEIPNQRTMLLRVEPGEVNLERLVRTDRIARDVASGAVSPGRGTALLDEVAATPRRYPAWLYVLAIAVNAAAVARLFGGSARDVVASLGVGLVVGVVGEIGGRHRRARRVVDTIAAAFAAAIALLAARFMGASSYLVTVSGLVFLLPGLSLTMAIGELATRNLVSGTARFTGALMVFFSLAFGIAIGRQFEPLLFARVLPSPAFDPAADLPQWTLVIAVAVAVCTFTVLFRAQPRDSMVIALSGAVAFAASLLSRVLEPEVGACAAAFAVGVVGNAYARFSGRPSSIAITPGILLLVPGSVGFSSLSALLDDQTVAGIDTAFRMLLVGVGIVTGMLLANVAVPTRQAL